MSFIEEIAPYAQKIQKEFHILASLIIAQAILESNWGKSGLAVKGNNLFGIKGSYKGQSITMQTTEYKIVNGKNVPYQVDAAFRKYPSRYESLYDLANLYKNGVSWDRNKYSNIIGETDYKKAAQDLQADGFATDPNYATKVINIIETNKLTKYDVKEEPKPNVDEKYTVVTSLNGYLTAADAKAGKNIKGTVKAGTYFVFNKSDGMINVTTKVGVPGSWINPTENTAAAPVYHTVVKGDTVSELAVKYGTPQANIKKWNNLNDDYLIKIGQRLRVK